MRDGGKNTKSSEVGTKRKIAVAVFLIVCGFAVVIIKIGTISLAEYEKYSSLAISQQLRDTVVTADRGTIYDTNMNVLAESASVWTVALSPMDIKNKDDYEVIAKGLSPILGIDEQTIFEKCHEKNYYSILKRKVDQPVVDEIRAFMLEKKISGISFTADSKRYYRYGNFCAQVLGFVGYDNYGMYGVEAYYDDYLSGVAGREITAKNAWGSDMYYQYKTTYDAQQGSSLVLTIDEVIQHYLESALETAVKEHNVKHRACGIVMNVNTGEILGMATKPDFDPNDPLTIYDETAAAELAAIEDKDEYNRALKEAQELQWNNKNVSEIYEPGSVFKVVTASAALETGACSLSDTFYCNGSYQVTPQVRMSCAVTTGHGSEDFEHAIINSCNPAFIEIGKRLGASNSYNYWRAFGLTEKTGVDLPGEAQSQIVAESILGVVQLASCSFGQSNSITPLQMTTAFAAVVNGGYLVQPHVVKEILDVDGNIVKSFSTEVKRQVISEETSAQMCSMLEQVVLQAGGKNAYVAGFRLGGKSGTAQKLGGRQGAYWVSFSAFAPADDPEVICLIILDEAYSDLSIYGSRLVGPVVASVMSDVLPYIGVEPVYTEEELKYTDVSTPNVEGISLTAAYASLNSSGLTYETLGDGTTVVKQFPSASQAIPRGSSVILYTSADYEERFVTVPDLDGMSASEASSALSSGGLNIRINGASAQGTAILQSCAAGASVPMGTVVEVEFADSETYD